MHFSILASGSTGNAIFISTAKTRLLVDAGLTGKKLEELLHQIGQHPKDLDAILITHEHSDHIKGLGVLARRYKIPIYANAQTWLELEKACGPIDLEQKFHFERGEILTLGDVEIESFGLSHDAREPMAFCFHHEGKKLGIATDLGYVSEKIKGILKGAHVLIFEANHDVHMLLSGSYPWHIKRRILSDVGHLSNEDSGEALAEIITEATSRVYLAHLSQDNNMRELARMTVEQILKGAGIEVGQQVRLYDTYPDRPTPLAVL